MLAKQTERFSFSSVKNRPDYPDFLDIQIKSFQDFFQLETKSEERGNEGLYNTFLENFPITDTRNQFVLEFLDYFVDPPRYSIQECIERGLTYSVPLKARLKLYCTDPEHEDFETIVQDVYLGTIPYMTPSGTFCINGAERVVVSQLHRSPGVFFGQSFHANGTKLYSARVIPFKGSWIEFATDINSVMYAYIDRKKKLPVTTLFRAIGFERDKDILEIFDLAEEVKVSKTGLKKVLGRKLAARVLNTWYEDFVDEDTGEVVSIERNEIVLDRDTELDKDHIEEILETGTKTILLHKEDNSTGDYAIIHNTLQKDPTNSEKEAVEHIYRQLRNAEPPDEETARGIIDKLFFSDQRYSLGEVGRYRMNKKLGLDVAMDKQVLTKEDIITIVKYLIELINSKAEIDDIDHLSNRRVRTVGEQLSQQFGVGLARMARTIRERMNVRDNEVFTPIDLINAKTLSSVINSFFGTNQLSQFMDQTNPLAEITHKRRLSALGPGGLSRERAGFEVRDVHYTHYGRLCPIETPEGPNIGLISSLSVYAKVNGMGFIETPYRTVEDGKINISEEPIYLSAEEEEGKKIAQANIPLGDDGTIDTDKVIARMEGDFPVVDPKEVHYTDVAPNQISSISASLIPFLEHDDANRALMGSNMMRQAVPLLRADSPIVGTGLERQVATDSRVLINAEGEGEVEYVDAQKITIKYDRTEEERMVSFDSDSKTYDLIKFRKTNQGTSINLKPIVSVGDRVTKGQVLCQGYATDKGELALGRNMKVAFMPWKGYNFEDAIVISEKVVRDDIFTSIHIDEYSLEVRDTKLGNEELTNDIPNVSEDATKDLDEHGMIRIGAEVKPGDILIGKITPKGESDPTPEEKLLRAIFGDKAGDVKDASLKASPSLSGVVINKKLFARAIKDKRKRAQDKEDVAVLEKKYEAKFAVLKSQLVDKLFAIVGGKTAQGVQNDLGEEVLPKGKKYTLKMLNSVDDYTHLTQGTWTTDDHTNALVADLLHNYKIKENDLQGNLRREKFTISVGDELPSGILKLAKVYIAKKRKLKVGDKMAGRHGNKGIVARIVRQEDMPFLDDGTPVDIVLNPLGVPSRMNIGQIYETVLGWAGQKLGKKYATPIFDGASLDKINELTDEAGIPRFGHTYLFDGGTGERFDQRATVGVIYMLKLGHMIDDKMHARSIGPYSLITQQPLGGKAQFGGQRFGEMEVWALEAYGASSTLREILTVKSDDVIGRAKTYESIVKGEPMPEPGLPESFNVLMHELKGLGLDLKLEE
ncbi:MULTISPECIES: DNA-directed RNA polymerase subunit beta [Zunongwangia]|jgi:DNA-directed RNA polymerase subunit beta|uniref:DNA-directed RNA polymerase subunit beta n=1 Tax=Zunongwangia profunda (strain DSM 18752 / CCTCC AB 206139 / SM-A87) TaxID=655815 RepID=D5BIQ6_ZUNPS|nr:DNA-directed RNA polymerase subunit beta [Zunongwangia profunda]ADF51508.1 DNA-directed RNA polymerase subunit beta [Zunongwangia profunda SM-A87]MAC66222.1 DNA-directed RNA polymerase subunit beta [Flavobacteriaceae bacterium]MAS69361.1 DNA-directed RNA polymerase subunit beta [Zunongwangia sp.]MCC4230225.1 DNA-directed RNA polymerase subunit beta [Zunongwangia profunda]|tara:strand:- start:2421 stop:6233 length:3813 start_codon:yes stop_codon:yes gene_type:complete